MTIGNLGKTSKMPADNTSLNHARSAKNDEFYTRYEDVEEELRHYDGQLRGRRIYLNCDDPYESNFFKYFVRRFDEIGIESLECTGYRSRRYEGHGIRARVTRVDGNVPDERERERERERRNLRGVHRLSSLVTG